MLFQDFQHEFITKKYIDASIFEAKSGQLGMAFSVIAYVPVIDQNWENHVFDFIKDFTALYSLHPNDIVIICGRKRMLRRL